MIRGVLEKCSRLLALPPDAICVYLTLHDVVCTLIVVAQVILHALHEVCNVLDALLSKLILISAIMHRRVWVPADRYSAPSIVQSDVVEEPSP